MPFDFQSTSLPGVLLVQPKVFGDERGFFFELFKRSEFTAAGIDATFVQFNCSKSSHGVLRGLHFQRPPQAQGKLVGCFAGRIFDVVVDLRQGTPTFGRWFGVELSAADKTLLYVPPGLAHGFCVVSETAEILYAVNGAEYCPAAEGGIIWNDPDLAIPWPVEQPTLSEKDSRLPTLAAWKALSE